MEEDERSEEERHVVERSGAIDGHQ